jgi:hypothetical protein
MKLICDYHHGSLPHPAEYSQELQRMKISERPADAPEGKRWSVVRNQSVIFVDSDAVGSFLQDVAPQIQTPFVLVSGDSDTSIPYSIEEATRASHLIRKGKILHWYAMNCQIQLDPDYFTCLPNGISQWNHQREAMQLAFEEGVGLVGGGLKQQRRRSQSKKRESPMALISFDTGTNIIERMPLFELGCKNETSSSLHDLAECIYNGKMDGKLEQLEFYRFVSTFKFVFSPHGAGLDCYRTYEALYLGCYPIVKKSSLDVLYENLPVLIVGEWDDITRNCLRKHIRAFRRASSITQSCTGSTGKNGFVHIFHHSMEKYEHRGRCKKQGER